ncbi:cytochrome P450 78A4-like [Cryptomeria japonica]|uniref:cytochrome P450 78A4-like n=1 Tax=Cryptomeria japonica TaxID=3369 RepID=UPI0027DA4FC2|nr:cytochrome P450 78A4-like [Cryptomeria japonica]
MESRSGSCGGGGGWWLYAISLLTKDGRGYMLHNTDHTLSAWPLYVAILLVAACAVVVAWLSPGGCAWAARKKGGATIPGPRGFPIIGSLIDMSRGLAHRRLAQLADIHGAKKLMAFSLGSTPAVITSDPEVARELLSSVNFSDRPLKQSAQQLMFGRAIGFAPNGEYWRMLRRISATHLFGPRRIAAHEPGRQADSLVMLKKIHEEYVSGGVVLLRRHLQAAALNNIMGSVFGRRFDICGDSEEVRSLREMVEEGFELLGAFNWADHLPWLRFLDPLRIHSRCASLVPRVRGFVRNIIEEHRLKDKDNDTEDSDFVDVLLSLNGEDKLDDEDMISVLWEMIFRGTETTALLTEWTMAEMVRNPGAQRKLQEELEVVVGKSRSVRDSDICKLHYLQAVVKETLRMHPPGPLLSWARLSTRDTNVGDGKFCVPASTTAMVNMWSITRDPLIWDSPDHFRPERFLESEGGENVDVRGNDLRLAPFGSGRRVCPGKALGLSTVHLWVAKLLHHFYFVAHHQHPVDLSEVLKLSCEMVHPLQAVPVMRVDLKIV